MLNFFTNQILYRAFPGIKPATLIINGLINFTSWTKKHFVSFIKVAPSLSQDGWRSSSPGLHPFSAEWFLSLPPSGFGSAECSTWSWCLQLSNLWLDETVGCCAFQGDSCYSYPPTLWCKNPPQVWFFGCFNGAQNFTIVHILYIVVSTGYQIIRHW